MFKIFSSLLLLIVLKSVAGFLDNEDHTQPEPMLDDSIVGNLQEIIQIPLNSLVGSVQALCDYFYLLGRYCGNVELPEVNPEVVMECVQEYGNTLMGNVEGVPDKFIEFCIEVIDMVHSACAERMKSS